MATVPGGLFDNSTINTQNGAEISSFLNSLGITESSITTVTVDNTTTTRIDDKTSFSFTTQLLGSDKATLKQTASGTVLTGTVQTPFGKESTASVASFDTTSGAPGTMDFDFDDGSTPLSITADDGTNMVVQKVSSSDSGSDAGTQTIQEVAFVLSQSKGGSASDTVRVNKSAAAIVGDTAGTVSTQLLSFSNDTGNDLVSGGEGNDTVFGGAGNDLVSGGEGNDTVVGLSADLDGAPGRAVGDITVVGSEASEGETIVSILDIFDMQSGSSLNVSKMEKILLVGDGRLVIMDDTNATVYGDATDQIIVGGEGNDTLVGGGGSDSLVGGAGENTFGFDSIGQFTIQDFDAGQDVISFGDAGLQSLEDLAQILTGAADVDGNAVFTFFSGENAATITIVGMSVNEITADMVNFDL